MDTHEIINKFRTLMQKRADLLTEAARSTLDQLQTTILALSDDDIETAAKEIINWCGDYPAIVAYMETKMGRPDNPVPPDISEDLDNETRRFYEKLARMTEIPQNKGREKPSNTPEKES